MKENENKAVELSDEDLAQVSGGKTLVTYSGLCGNRVEILDSGVCDACTIYYPCWDCQFRASWCQNPIHASSHENRPIGDK